MQSKAERIKKIQEEIEYRKQKVREYRQKVKGLDASRDRMMDRYLDGARINIDFYNYKFDVSIWNLERKITSHVVKISKLEMQLNKLCRQ